MVRKGFGEEEEEEVEEGRVKRRGKEEEPKQVSRMGRSREAE